MRADSGKPVHRWTDLHKISPNLRRAVIVSEDARFYEHAGFDLQAIEDAMRINWARGQLVFGASTITQQLAKNLYLSPSRSILRKIHEILIAVALERALSKERILELYLNLVEWGPHIYGAEAAARYYFHTSALHLSRTEAAFLASILPNPKLLGKSGFRVTARVKTIRRRM